MRAGLERGERDRGRSSITRSRVGIGSPCGSRSGCRAWRRSGPRAPRRGRARAPRPRRGRVPASRGPAPGRARAAGGADHLERELASAPVSCTPLYGSCATSPSSHSFRTMPDADAAVTPMRSASALVLTAPDRRLERVDRLRVVLDGRGHGGVTRLAMTRIMARCIPTLQACARIGTATAHDPRSRRPRRRGRRRARGRRPASAASPAASASAGAAGARAGAPRRPGRAPARRPAGCRARRRHDGADAEQHEQRRLPARAAGAERRRRVAVERAEREPAVGAASAAPRRGEPARRARSASVMPSKSPNSSSSSRGGAAGDSASSAPSAEQRETATATPRSAPTRGRGPRARSPRRRRDAAGGAEHERRAGQRGEHEPGQQPWLIDSAA